MLESKIEYVVQLLLQKQYKISFAESCTGGLLASSLVGIPNASKVFDESIVTYSDASKVKYLGVNPNTIHQYGVVSEEVALEMALGIAKTTLAQVGIGITGFAGPGGGSIDKPVGTVCFGFSIQGITFSSTVYFKQMNRNEVRESAVTYVWETLISKLTEKEETK
ncbi:MAG: CinA family protein [Prevotella sp.]|nr:CinA family protein [Staphylococcus sp.]MCM1351031.1 CinA family protein [Prevotella sp.]